MPHHHLLLPGGVWHAHVHLDKCFLLSSSDSEQQKGCCRLEDGTFEEALSLTSTAKEKFTQADVEARGERLIRAALSHGVVGMRAHVEVDPTVSHVCLHAGLALKQRFASRCAINLCAFAQDPLFSSSSSSSSSSYESTMHALMRTAASNPHVSAVGCTPYVESSLSNSLRALRFIFSLAREFGKDVDLHIDYSLDASSPLLWDALALLKQHTWTVDGRPRRLTMGHATVLSQFDAAQLDRLAQECKGEEVVFVALPHSDLYMQGRDVPYAKRPRATLPALELAKRGVRVAVDVNNVGNLFTPQGDGDPLALLPLLVGVYQDATPDALAMLLQMVTVNAAYAAGFSLPSFSSPLEPRTISSTSPGEHENATATVLHECTSVQEAVLRPPYGRTAWRSGRKVAERRVEGWVAEEEE